MSTLAARALRPPLARSLIVGLAVVAVAGHLAAAAMSPYELHRDELLYLAMGRHLRLFAMDFPPFIALAAELQRRVLGESLVALRFLPAVASGALVLLAGAIARELGGSMRAQGLAAFAVLLAPLFLRAGALFQPVVFDQLWWTLGFFALARLGRAYAVADAVADGDAARAAGAGRDWLLLGLAGGLGLLTKFSIAFFAVPVLVAIVLSPLRSGLRTRAPWIALAVAALLGAPSVVGQVTLGWPVRGQMADLAASQLARVTPAAFLGEQPMMIGPAFALAVAGLVGLLAVPALRPWRPLGVTALGAFALLIAMQGKAYYVGPVYPALLAAGAVLAERLLGWQGTLVRGGLVVATLAFGFVAIPFGLPIVPPAEMARLAAAVGAGTTTNRGEQLALPQDYADMLGWRERVAAVAQVYRALPPEERARVVVAGENYGQAGALAFYGPRFGLPAPISAAGSFWFFGPGLRRGDVLLILGAEPEDLRELYGEATVVRRLDDAYWVPEERGAPITVARRPTRSLQEVWPSLAGQN